jgi:glycosyltransferase involved in cell wall biosynthesis
MTLHDYSFRCATKRYMYHGEPCLGPGPLKCLECASIHYGPAKGMPTTIANWASSLGARMAVDRFLPVSMATAQGNGLVGSHLPYEVIPNFVPDDIGVAHGDNDPQLAALPEEPFLLFVGDLTPAKGVDVLLRAYGQLVAAPPLMLIGRAAADTPTDLPPGATILQSWPHSAIMQAWRRSMIALVPSVWPDPCPTVAMEAMATGRPVVASHIGGLVDIVADGESGCLVPAGDASALRDAVARLLEDAALRERMGQAASQRVVAFQARTVVPRIERVYEEVSPGSAL